MEERIKKMEEKFAKLLEQKEQEIEQLKNEIAELKATLGEDDALDKHAEDLLKKIKAQSYETGKNFGLERCCNV